jgi:hypothetical protein
MYSNNQLTITFLIFSFVFISILGMGQSIDELNIIPEDPINTETVVSVIATAWHPSQGCPIVETEFIYNQDTITVVVQHELGLFTAICNSIDTTSLGSHLPGTYTVEYVMISGVFGDIAVADTAYTEFTVEGVNSIGAPIEKSILNLYPNPSNGNVFIETDWRGQMAIYDIMGKELENFRIDRSPFSFSTEDFSPGVYFLVPFGEKQFDGGKFVVR